MTVPPKEQYVDLRGLRCHYVEWGHSEAPPAVLLHGLRSYGHVWDDVAVELEPYFRILAPDIRGRGDTQWAPDGDYSNEAYVQDLAEFVRLLGLDRFLLIGHSMGGQIAQRYTARHPARVTGLVVVDVGPEIPRERAERIAQEMAEGQEEFTSWEAARAALLRQLPGLAGKALETRLRWSFTEHEGRITWRYDKRIRQGRRDVVQVLADPLWPVLPSIVCPTLLIRGERSDVLPREMAERMAKALPKAELAEIEGVGHMVFEEAPRAFNDILMRWLKRHGLATASFVDLEHRSDTLHGPR